MYSVEEHPVTNPGCTWNNQCAERTGERWKKNHAPRQRRQREGKKIGKDAAGVLPCGPQIIDDDDTAISASETAKDKRGTARTRESVGQDGGCREGGRRRGCRIPGR